MKKVRRENPYIYGRLVIESQLFNEKDYAYIKEMRAY